MVRTLVIGGSKFVGRHLVAEMLRRGHQVSVLNRGKTAQAPPGVEHIQCDRKDHAALKACLQDREFDAVFDIIAYVPDDVRPLVPMLDGRVGRFVVVSTGSVYKTVDIYPAKEHCEKVTDNSAGDYGYNKQLIEQILFEAYEKTGFPVSIVRPGIIYGPHNPVYRESLFFDRVVKSRPVLIPGDGRYLVQFGYVDDLATLLLLCAERAEALGQAFNFAGEYSAPMDDYVEAIFGAAGRRTEVVHYDPERLGMTAADVSKIFPYRWKAHTMRDISKAIYVLGYKQQVSLWQGLSEAFKWFAGAGIERKEIDFALEDRIIEATEHRD